MKQQLPRKINLEWYCNLTHCEYKDHQCLTPDAVTGETHVCPNLSAKIPQLRGL